MRRGAVLVASLLALTACGGDDRAPRAQVPSTMTLESEAFADQGEIPRAFTCDGEDRSPPLRWSGAPEGTKAFALTIVDPEAAGSSFTHWMLFNIPASVTALEPGEVPAGASQALSGFGKAAYGGPCPPEGRHAYIVTIFALPGPLTDAEGLPVAHGASASVVGTAIADAPPLARGMLVGTYLRSR